MLRTLFLTAAVALALAPAASAQMQYNIRGNATVNTAGAAVPNTIFLDYISEAFIRPDLTANANPTTGALRYWAFPAYGSSPPSNPATPGVTPTALRTYTPTTFYGASARFAPVNNFNLGNVTIDSTVPLTGTGTETRTITGLTADWYGNINPGRFAYTTSFLNVSGTLTFTNGVATDVSLTSNVVFTITPGQVFPNGGVISDPGFNTFTISNGDFSLVNQGSATSLFGPGYVAWASDGSVNAIAPVPEPATALLAGGAALGLYRLRRKRRAG